MSGLDHIGINVIDYERSKAFYVAALKPLGLGIGMDIGMACGFGPEGGHSFFWLASSDVPAPPGLDFATGRPGHFHVAFNAKDRATVDAFHAAALAAGGTDNGEPGIRSEYHANYYGAFVLDPDGHNIEAVCHAPE